MSQLSSPAAPLGSSTSSAWQPGTTASPRATGSKQSPPCIVDVPIFGSERNGLQRFKVKDDQVMRKEVVFDKHDARQPLPPLLSEPEMLKPLMGSEIPTTTAQFEEFVAQPGSFQRLEQAGMCAYKLRNQLRKQVGSTLTQPAFTPPAPTTSWAHGSYLHVNSPSQEEVYQAPHAHPQLQQLG